MSSIRIRPESRNLYFDFHWRGIRCREYTTLNDTPSNRRKMESVLKRIESEIALNTFDYARYFPRSALAARFAAEAVVAPTISSVVEPLNSSTAASTPVVADTPVFREFVTLWMREREIEWRHSYRMAVTSIMDSHLLPEFGDTPIRNIDRAALMRFRAKLGDRRIAKTANSEGRPLTNTTINRILGIVRQVLDEGAARHGFPNPALTIKRLKIKRTDILPFGMDEVRQLLDRIRPDYRPYLTVRIFTGLRSAEAHGLKWKHVDFARRELVIRETFANGRTEYTKTDGSQREVQMSQPVIEALRQIQPDVCDPEDYVFHTRTGRPIDNKNFNDRVWLPLLRHLGLKRRRPYQMRHTCATLWLAAGENPEWIARQLGHTTTEMLFRTYSRYVPNLTRNDGSAFDRLVSAAMNGGVRAEGNL